jgi:small-conductance mechanosensitive channel
MDVEQVVPNEVGTREVVVPASPPVAPGWDTWAWLLGGVVAAIVVGVAAHWALFLVLRRIAARTPSIAVKSLVKRLAAPSLIGMPLLAVQFVVGSSGLESRVLVAVRQGAAVALIATVTWAAVRVIQVIEDVIDARHPITVADNLAARRIQTQVKVLSRTAAVVVTIVGAAAALMTFPQVRQVGASLLASAGIAGIIAGVAARPVLENLLAGMQLALTEPIRLDDVLVVEGEWGRVEEIRATYVVLRIWDDRRLVIPLTYFITKPIENWTRRAAALLGTVFLYVDYSVPVERVRAELKRILDESARWDKRGWALQVTDATERTVQLRALMSAPDGPTAFELRCEVREKLIEFIRSEFPGSLPRVRVEDGEPRQAALTGTGP